MEVKHEFIHRLRQSGMMTKAAREAGTTRRQIEKYMQEDSVFKEQVEETLDLFMDEMEAEAIRRAMEGVEEGVYYKGEMVDTVMKKSDALLGKILTARRPEVYGNKQEINSNAPIIVQVAQFSPPDDMDFLE